MRFLRTNTAVIITVGPFYDKTDGVTIETALTITNERITLTADTDDGSAPTNILDNVTGATSGTSNDLNYITGNDAGMMQLELSAANTNRLGRMFLSITDAANHVPVFHEFMVLPAMIYDAFVAGTDVLDASVTQWLGQTVAAVDTTGYPKVTIKDGTGQGEILTTSGKVDGVILTDTLTTYTGNTPQTGDSYARLGAPAGASVSADILVLDNLVDDLESRLTAARAGYLDNVNNATLAGASFPTDPADQSLVIAATDAITSAIAALNNLSQANIRSAVGLASANLDTQLGAIDDYLDTEVAAIKAKTDALPATPANEATLTTIAGYLDTEVAAIKAKTDLLPASPAATGDAMTLTSGERTAIADALLTRDWSAVAGEAARSVLNALRFLRNKWSVSGTTLTVTTEDDTTAAWTSTVTVDATADPVTGSDPA
jgi:hypothetical protein